MTVLIKGMNMPEKCGLCVLFHAESPMYCTVVKGQKTVGAPYGMPRPSWCPLKEEPESIPMKFIDEFIREHYGKWQATSLGAMLSAWKERKARYVKDEDDQEELSEKLKV